MGAGSWLVVAVAVGLLVAAVSLVAVARHAKRRRSMKRFLDEAEERPPLSHQHLTLTPGTLIQEKIDSRNDDKW